VIAQGLLIVFKSLRSIIFTLLRVVPGDPVRLIVGRHAPPDVVEKGGRTRWGCAIPSSCQYGRTCGACCGAISGRS